MSLVKMWEKYKKIIIIVGFVIGFAYVLGFLPETIDMLGDNTDIAYGVLIALGGFTFYKFYWNLRGGSRAMPQYQKYVPPRNLNNPRYTDDVLRSRGVDPKREEFIMESGQKERAPERDRIGDDRRSDDGDVFDKFKKDY